MKLALIFVALAVVCYLSAASFLYFGQRRILYAPSLTMGHPSAYNLSQFQELHLQTRDKVTLTVWYGVAPSATQTILYFQGNAGNIGDRAEKFASFFDAGYSVLAVSYRGYGSSTGTPSEKGFYEDARTAIDYLKSQNIPLDFILVYGESLGTGVATHVAANYPIGGLILEAPYTSIVDIGQSRYPFIPVRRLLRDKFDSYLNLPNIKVSTLIIHGTEDTVIPTIYGKRMYSLANEPKKIKLFEHTGHSDFDHQLLINTVKAFF